MLNPQKKFVPTAEMVSAARATFMAMALTESIRPIVEGYQRCILVEKMYPPAAEWVKYQDKKGSLPTVILEPKDSFLLSDEHSKEYFALCDAARVLNKLAIRQPGNCPLLEAEALLVEARQALIAAFEPVTNINAHKALCHGMDTYEQYVEIMLKLMAPFVGSSEEILKPLRTPAAAPH